MDFAYAGTGVFSRKIRGPRYAEIMKDDVEMSNQYFAGEVYWYELHEFVDDGSEDGCWDEIDNCGGFYGDDPPRLEAIRHRA